ncbi:Glycogen operon protein GlgX [Roseobacter fucihabitans]|uniref:Glycogen operon protein GlgX n=1 Tax=Roseobacter fucihabitans TaxID=1537242 RepID=A0ABZ2BRH4_9RHOB|nr:glycogen debranching protein GlgX [Roseobacter litoralis]MBC6964400.1 Glycogen debranching enzyme [Roseobacter litoralis]
MEYGIASGTPHRMGAHLEGDTVNFAVFSAHATRIDLCLFSPDGARETARLSLPERTGDIWHGSVAGLPAGTLYGYRAHGSYAPEHGHRFNANKLLLDPYTRELRGRWINDPAVLGYDLKSSALDLSFDSRDSARFVPKSVVSDPETFAAITTPLGRPWEETLIYETHVKGATQLHPDVSAALRGTYDGLASDAVIEHLQKMGVTAVELLPVQSFINDGFLLEKGLTNYWGYNTIGFFTPEPRYFGPEGLQGFRNMVRRFHNAGIEVILDVVYNHTAEGDHRGPTLCYRGLDNASYYRLINGQPRYYVNDTGTGNTVNVSHPHVLRMVMDSLRFWVECMGVDGFRFDLATTLAREDHGFDVQGGFLDALRQDPVLAGIKMIAEPWDIGPGGYRLGQFPPKFGEWNDAYRDTVRRFWKGEAHSAQELGARLLGSAGEFDRGGRRAWSSVNFLAAHDGFTLADITRYARRHNEANGEENQDGHNANHSDNCGVEGPTEDPEITDMRIRRQRNMLATLFLSQGTPMLLAGDEIGNTQWGNNNAYCQDNEIAWLDWAAGDAEMADFVAMLAALRKAHRVLRQSRFLHAAQRPADGLRDVEWMDFQGHPLNWRDPNLSSLCLMLRASAEAAAHSDHNEAIFAIFHRTGTCEKVSVPAAPSGFQWQTCLDTASTSRGVDNVQHSALTLQGPCVVALALMPET